MPNSEGRIRDVEIELEEEKRRHIETQKVCFLIDLIGLS
jgi:hypothetical protein